MRPFQLQSNAPELTFNVAALAGTSWGIGVLTQQLLRSERQVVCRPLLSVRDTACAAQQPSGVGLLRNPANAKSNISEMTEGLPPPGGFEIIEEREAR